MYKHTLSDGMDCQRCFRWSV